MTVHLSSDFLHSLRNHIDITELIPQLGLQWKDREGYRRFLCPLCGDDHTATNPRTNLARCFGCQRNFNPIDLTMATLGCDFLAAVRFLAAQPKTKQTAPSLIQSERDAIK